MIMRVIYNLSIFIAALALADLAFTKHVHHHRLKHQHRRRQASATAQISSSTQTVDVGAAVIADVSGLEDAISSLPTDLLAFIVEAEAKLQQAESVLSSLLGTPAASTTPPSSSSSHVSVPARTSYFVTSTLPLPPPRTLTPRPYPSPTSTFTITHTVERTSIVVEETTVSPSKSSSTQLPTLPGGLLNMTTVTPPASTSTSRSKLVLTTMTDYSLTPAHATTTTTAIPTPSSSSYVFNASAQDNVAVYYGQSPDTQIGDLSSLCNSSNVDIVILAFVTSFFSPAGMPSASFGPACLSSTNAQQLHAPGLTYCPDLIPEIESCQTLGKKVLVSLGGYTGNTSIPTAAAATQLASSLWSLFGAGTTLDSGLRPFGPNITLDGFDLDNETHDPAYWDVLASSLRSNFASDTSKKYYLSSAPQCPQPDSSIPLAAMAVSDFVWVQFYNNPACNLDSDGFQNNFADWSAELSSLSNETKVFIGAGASAAAGSGYVPGAGLKGRIELALEMDTPNLGGVMIWDGSIALDNTVYGEDYLAFAKAALQ